MNIQQMSVQAAVMIVFIVIIRALSMGRLPKWSFQALWGMALLRLLVPMSIESPLSLYGALEVARTALIKPTPAPINMGMPITDTATMVHSVAPIVTKAQATPTMVISPWLLAWIIGMVCMAGFFLLTHIRCRRIYAQSLPMKEIQVRSRTVFVRTSDRVSTPLTYGVLQPVVLLPKKLSLGGDALSYVLAHELSHIRHHDALKKWLLTAALCLHWFNPLVWVMFILANRDIELCCDESVLRGLRDDARVSYATMLIDLMQKRDGLMPLANHFSRNATEERIVSIMKHKKTSLISVVIAIALLFATGAALATSAVTEKPNLPPVVALSASGSFVDGTMESAELYAIDDSNARRNMAAGIREAIKPYQSFGLSSDNVGMMYSQGEIVRSMYDPQTGVLIAGGFGLSYPENAVDLVAVYQGNQLSGLRIATQKEFEERTRSFMEATLPDVVGRSTDEVQSVLAENDLSVTAVEDTSEWWYDKATNSWMHDGVSYTPEADTTEWWTAEEFESYLAQQRAELPKMIGQRFYDDRRGWYTWSQANTDEMLAFYQNQLAEIRKGAFYSKDGTMAMVIDKADVISGTSERRATSASEVIPEDVSEAFSPDPIEVIADPVEAVLVQGINAQTSAETYLASDPEKPMGRISVTVSGAEGYSAGIETSDGKVHRIGPYKDKVTFDAVLQEFLEEAVLQGLLFVPEVVDIQQAFDNLPMD